MMDGLAGLWISAIQRRRNKQQIEDLARSRDKVKAWLQSGDLSEAVVSNV